MSDRLHDYIGSRPDWLEHLEAEFKIDVVRDGDLASLKYNQIESPMHDPLVRQCRGAVVNVPSATLLAHPYDKFWNYGETLADSIDWPSARVQEKLDGSLMILYWSDGEWRVASSGHPTAGGTYGTATTETFREAFWRVFAATGMKEPQDTGVTYMFELCGDANRIVVKHDAEKLVAHGSRRVVTGNELAREALRHTADRCHWPIVAEHPLGSIDECLAAAEKLDPIQSEGFVVVDDMCHRVKIKSPRYVMLHHLKGAMSVRRAIEMWQTGEATELLAHFPEFSEPVLKVHDRLDSLAERALDTIIAGQSCGSRKEYAAFVKELPWQAVCFKFFGERTPSVQVVRDRIRQQTAASLERLYESVWP